MVSPSSSSSRRSTPCVEGCCGPILSVMTRGLTVAGFTSGAVSATLVITVSLTLFLFSDPSSDTVPGDVVILSQRMPLPIVRHHDAPQIGMVAEAHAEKVEGFAFVPAGPPPHAGHRIDGGIGARQAASYAQALVPFEAVEMIDHFKTRLPRIAVDARDRAQACKLQLVLEEPAHTHHFLGRDLKSQLAPVELAGKQGIRIESCYARRGGVFFK